MDAIVNTDALLYVVVAKTTLGVLFLLAGTAALFLGAWLYRGGLAKMREIVPEQGTDENYAIRRLHKDTWLPRGTLIRDNDEDPRFVALTKDMWVPRGTQVKISLDPDTGTRQQRTGLALMASSLLWGIAAYWISPVNIEEINARLADVQEHRIEKSLTGMEEDMQGVLVRVEEMHKTLAEGLQGVASAEQVKAIRAQAQSERQQFRDTLHAELTGLHQKLDFYAERAKKDGGAWYAAQNETRGALAGLKSELGALREHVAWNAERFAPLAASQGETRQALAGLDQHLKSEFGALREHIAWSAERFAPLTASQGEARQTLAGLDQQLREHAQALREQLEAGVERFDALTAGQDEVKQAVEGLGWQLREHQQVVHQQFDVDDVSYRAELAELREILSKQVSGKTPNQAIHDLTKHIETHNDRLDAIGERLDALASATAQDETRQALAGLEQQFREHAQALREQLDAGVESFDALTAGQDEVKQVVEGLGWQLREHERVQHRQFDVDKVSYRAELAELREVLNKQVNGKAAANQAIHNLRKYIKTHSDTLQQSIAALQAGLAAPERSNANAAAETLMVVQEDLQSIRLQVEELRSLHTDLQHNLAALQAGIAPQEGGTLEAESLMVLQEEVQAVGAELKTRGQSTSQALETLQEQLQNLAAQIEKARSSEPRPVPISAEVPDAPAEQVQPPALPEQNMEAPSAAAMEKEEIPPPSSAATSAATPSQTPAPNEQAEPAQANPVIVALQAADTPQLRGWGPYVDIPVAFRTGSVSELGDPAVLDTLGGALQHPAFAGKRILLQGYTDSLGNHARNLELSALRVQHVKRYLVEKFALKPRLIVVEGKGEADPVADNATPEGRRQNRRIRVAVKVR